MAQDPHTDSSHSPPQAISRGIVALHKRHLGRGPSHSKAYINEDVVTVVMSTMLTSMERVLADSGDQELVQDLRHSYLEVLCEDAKELVEEVTGRRVITVIDGHAIDSDYAVLCFPLEP